MVFALLTVEDLGDSDPRVLAAVHAIAITIVFSVVAHGVTARPLATRYLAAAPAIADCGRCITPRRVTTGRPPAKVDHARAAPAAP